MGLVQDKPDEFGRLPKGRCTSEACSRRRFDGFRPLGRGSMG